MDSHGNVIRAILVIVLLASPAMTMRIASNYSDNPYLQPLDLTEEGLAAVGEGKYRSGLAIIDVHVDWGREQAGPLTQDRLRDVIANTLKHQTEFYRFEFHDMPGGRIDVTFVVGPNSYGPFPPSRMVAGVNSALVALRMTNGPER